MNEILKLHIEYQNFLYLRSINYDDEMKRLEKVLMLKENKELSNKQR